LFVGAAAHTHHGPRTPGVVVCGSVVVVDDRVRELVEHGVELPERDAPQADKHRRCDERDDPKGRRRLVALQKPTQPVLIKYAY